MRSDLSLIADAVRLNEKKRKTHIQSAGLLLLMAGQAIAGTGLWTLSSDWTGSRTGNVNAILQDPAVPSQIFISTGNAFGRSFDSGNSWTEDFAPHGNPGGEGKLSGNPGVASVSLAQLPNVSNVLFVGTSGGGIYRSISGSTQPTWDTRDDAATPNTVSAPSPLTAYPWTQINTPAGSAGVVPAIATHRWNSWVAVSIAGQGVYVATNAVAADSCRLGDYIGTSPTGNYCTPSNLDLTWTSGRGTATSGTTTTLTDSNRSWTTNAFVGRTLRIVGGTNNGQTSTISGNTATTLTVAPAFSGAINATSAYVINSGLPNTPTANALTYDPNPGNTNVLYAGIGSQLQPWGNSQRTATSGTTTTLSDTGATWITDQWAGYYVRVISGTNAGLARQIASNTGTVLTTAAFPVALDSTSTYVIEGQGLFISTDNGATWTPAAIGSTSSSLLPGSFNINALVATSQNGGTVLYAATANGGTGASPAGIYRGVVNLLVSPPAVTWTRIADGSKEFAKVPALAFDPNTPNKIYAGTFGYGIFTATDNGNASTQTWTDISNGLNSSTNSKYVTTLSVDALNPARLYAGTYGGFYTYATYDDAPKTGLSISATTLTFSNTTPSQSITLTNQNTGTTPITFSDFSKTGNFEFTHGCPTSLQVGQSCTVTITYKPTKAANNENGLLTIKSDDPSSPATIILSGSASASLEVTPAALAFPAQAIGTTSNAQTASVRNTGLVNDTLSFNFVSEDFKVAGDCLPTTGILTSLLAGESCALSFTFTPSQSGAKTATMTINGNQSTKTVSLSGGGSGGSTSAGSASISTSSLTFPQVPPYQTSATLSVDLINTGSTAIGLTSAVVDNPAFKVDASACPLATLAGSQRCTILANYTPVDANPGSGTLTLTLSTGSTLSVQLAGTSADTTSLAGTAYGSTASRSLVGNFYFSSRETAKTGNLYIAAEVNGVVYFYDGISWFPWLTGSPKPFVSGASYANQSVSILNRMDTTSLRGVPIYLGFGTSITELQKNKTYSHIYTLQ